MVVAAMAAAVGVKRPEMTEWLDIELRLRPPGVSTGCNDCGHLPESRKDNVEVASTAEAAKKEETEESTANSLAIVPCAEPVERAAQEPRKRERDAAPPAMGPEINNDMMALAVYEEVPESSSKRAKAVNDDFIPYALPLRVQPLRALPPGAFLARGPEPDIVHVHQPPVDVAGAAAAAAVHDEVPGATEPTWIRDSLFPRLSLPDNLPLYFIAEKAVQTSDITPHQNRFLLPRDAIGRLRPLLSAEEREVANLVREDRRRPQPVEPQEGAGDGGRKKVRGRQHGGLPVRVAERSSDVSELMLTQWDGSRGTVLKGKGYLGIVGRGDFKKDATVEFWAFRCPPPVRLFGATIRGEENSLYLVMARKEGEQRRPAQLPPAPNASA